MEAEKGKYATISFTCKKQDGTVCGAPERTTLTFLAGRGAVPAALEAGICGMKPGEHRVLRVPAAQAAPFLARENQRRKSAPGLAGYEFGPGDSGDVLLNVPPTPLKPPPEPPPAEAELLFEVTLVALREEG